MGRNPDLRVIRGCEEVHGLRGSGEVLCGVGACAAQRGGGWGRGGGGWVGGDGERWWGCGVDWEGGGGERGIAAAAGRTRTKAGRAARVGMMPNWRSITGTCPRLSCICWGRMGRWGIE